MAKKTVRLISLYSALMPVKMLMELAVKLREKNSDRRIALALELGEGILMDFRISRFP
jgi:hypothetical protein